MSKYSFYQTLRTRRNSSDYRYCILQVIKWKCLWSVKLDFHVFHFLQVGHTCLIGSRRLRLNYEDARSILSSQGDIFPSAVRISNGLVPSTWKWQCFGCYSKVWELRVKRWKSHSPTRNLPPSEACAQQASYLSDHWEAHDEETNTAAQSEDRFVSAQVLGELIRDGGHYGLDGGKLE